MAVSIIVGDALSKLKTLPSESVHCCISSPPYYGLRDYGVEGQLGLEPSPDAYVARMVEVFREVRRVLRNDGTLWLNIGDSYAGGKTGNTNGGVSSGLKRDGRHESSRRRTNVRMSDNLGSMNFRKAAAQGCKPKDLSGIPWMLAFALRADGWYLRQDIIWAKPNPMPESVTDRCTKAHEYVFMLTKSARYFYDAEAIKEPFADSRNGNPGQYSRTSARSKGATRECQDEGFLNAGGGWNRDGSIGGRNKRSVWTVTTKPYKGAHFATFPPDLIEPCILAGTSERGVCPKCAAPWARVVERKSMVIQRSTRTHDFGHTRSSGTMLEPPEAITIGWRASCCCNTGDPVPATVLDPFFGAGTTGLVAEQHGRDCIGIELNPEYAEMAERRIAGKRLKAAA